MALFGEEKCIPTGLQHGTVTVKQGGQALRDNDLPHRGRLFRWPPPGCRLLCAGCAGDLARRDFTINAMAYSAEGLIDPFGGRATLPPISCGRWGSRNAALRRTRCASCGSTDSRPGSVLPSTQPPVLLPGHWGRIWTAFRRSASRRNCSSCWRHPAPGAIWNPPFWLLSCRSWKRKNSRKRFAELCRTIDRIESTAENVPVRLAALLCPLGEAGARKALRKLKCSNALTDEVTALEREAGGGAGSFLLGHEFELRHPADALCLERHSHPAGRCPNSNSLFPPQAAVVAVAGHSIARPIACGNRVPPQRTVLGETPGTPNTTLTVQAKRLLGRYELPTIQRLTALCSARHPEQAVAFAALRAEAEQLTAENACCRVSQLAVNGRDLMAAGVRPGPGLRQVLNALLEAVITGQTPNEKDALLAAAAEFSAS